MVALHRLDGLCAALNDVGVDGALAQEFDAVQLAGLLLKHPDELRADDLPLLLRVGHAGQLVQEAVHGVHIDQVGVHFAPEDLHHLLRLPFAQQAVVDVDAGELFADGSDEQGGHHGGVHAAGQGQQHLLVSHLAADELHLVGDEVVHIPVGLGAADGKDEVLQGGLARPVVGGPGVVPAVVHQQGGDVAVVNLLGHVDGSSVHHTVGAAVEDDALHVGQSFQLRQGDIVGVYLRIDPQGADLTGDFGVLLAAQVQYDDHILFHWQIASLCKFLSLSYHISGYMTRSGKNSFTKSTSSTWKVRPFRSSKGPAGVVN